MAVFLGKHDEGAGLDPNNVFVLETTYVGREHDILSSLVEGRQRAFLKYTYWVRSPGSNWRHLTGSVGTEVTSYCTAGGELTEISPFFKTMVQIGFILLVDFFQSYYSQAY